MLTHLRPIPPFLCFLAFYLLVFQAVVAEESAEVPAAPAAANYTFAAYMGNGLYGTTDSSLFVLNVPTTFNLHDFHHTRLRLSTSAGFFNYGRESIEDLELPDSIGTLTLIPGIEKTFYMSEHHHVIPHLDFGIGRDFSNGENAQIASIGIQSRNYYSTLTSEHVWVNKLLFAGYRTLGRDIKGNYVRLLTGFDYKMPVLWSIQDHPFNPTVYTSLSWDYNGIDYLDKLQSRNPRDFIYELGVSLYTHQPIDLWLTSVHRLGIGVQRTPFGNAIRLILGTPF